MREKGWRRGERRKGNGKKGENIRRRRGEEGGEEEMRRGSETSLKTPREGSEHPNSCSWICHQFGHSLTLLSFSFCKVRNLNR